MLYEYLLILLVTDYGNYDITLMVNTHTIFFSFILSIAANFLEANTPISYLSEREQQSS